MHDALTLVDLLYEGCNQPLALIPASKSEPADGQKDASHGGAIYMAAKKTAKKSTKKKAATKKASKSKK
jgi:hypothetical protein